ncbi:hypothetical protein AUQ37_03195 [Candidatus Methanomethylophilus sp. 1R26]|uniref:hypothetical protein n=1 Tax=Candidatus Methanomethylophilus sp. 1R26 TaxID=1769296 RepID=UPI0007366D6B|nr:hypothetical protein [Candidatus Methanomethylophilus sp. 1R26]KUE73256.1 hypothetical protein AUQ37_03195 [Candidatus Methanomethylophilus sp. 1R26]TQS82668.1 MAG: hypothetical protein A3Q59_04090 [Methanomethylophilus alvi]
MSEFDKLCKEFEKIDPATYIALLAAKSRDVLAGMAAVTGDLVSAVESYVDIVMMAVASDGKLSKEEFALIAPGLAAAVGQPITYEDAKKIMNKSKLDSRDNKAAVDALVDLVGSVSPEIKDDIVILTMVICAADGRISGKEKAWIKQLIRE